MPKIFWSKIHSHIFGSWKWMEGQTLTGRWPQGPVSSFDWGELVQFDRTLERSSDRTLRASVRSTPVRFQRWKIMTGLVRLVLTGRCPAFGHYFNTGVRGELTGESGHPTEAHNNSFFSRCYKYFLHSCVGVLLLIPTAEKHLWECQEE